MPLEHPAEVPEQFDDPEQERDAATLGMWVFLSTEMLFFGVLFASYTITRIRFPDAFLEASHHNVLSAGIIETAVLLTSTFTMALAVRAVSRNRIFLGGMFLIFTILLGLGFLGIHLWEYYKHYREHLIPGLGFEYHGAHPQQVEMFFFLYYVMTGWHVIHLFIGVVVLCVITVLNAIGKFSSRYHIPMEISGLYWHFVDIVWVFLFPLFYLVS
jgi:cytochrome c oxidase subunit 3